MGSSGPADDDLVVLDKESATGQFVRTAVCLSSITLKPLKIGNIRQNASIQLTGTNKPGMTAELVAIVNWLADQTGAEVVGNVIESSTLEFWPKFRPSSKQITRREIKIDPGSMLASSMLHFQTVLPFLLYIGSEDPDNDKPIELRLKGATYSPGTPSFEYIDQVFLPALRDYFGVDIICQLVKRGWDRMTRKCLQEGTVRFKIRPRKNGTTLSLRPNAKLCDDNDDEDLAGSVDNVLSSVDVTIVAPPVLHEPLQKYIQGDIEARFGNIDIEFKLEESGHDDRVYVLLVGKSEHCRWGRDYLMTRSLKESTILALTKEISGQVCKDLEDEVNSERAVDRFLEDQLVVYQCLAEGRTCFDSLTVGDSTNSDSSTTQLSKAAALALLPNAQYNGKICIGASVRVGQL
ncbi:RNA 3'-terminal phosphate cyclase [Diaporthe helianthi]|uniref:RNA 3'-terminal phosphate cyclase n=1 Tax=Diaporthe helianthi TaxID=158607 RepID=A0A2P5I542_DIAHE|nr:RNA 3'-terminal phosphate cyclase [Diaporthe helianthi]